MNDSIIRRAAALALALILSISLTAPGYAGIAGGTGSADTLIDSYATAGEIVPVENITLDYTSLKLDVGASEQLTAIVSPKNATDPKVTWTSSAPSVASVSDSGKVTAVSRGAATITATAGGKTATCQVSVGVSIAIAGLDRWTSNTPESDKVLTVNLSGVPAGTTPQIRWTAKPDSPQAGVVAPTFSAANSSEAGKNPLTGGTTVAVNEVTAGIFSITAEYLENGVTVAQDTMQLTITGIILSGTTLKMDEKNVKTLEMVENGSAVLSAIFCDYTGYSNTRMEWSSDDPYVVSVMPDAGNLNAWHAGTTFIKVTKDNYSAYCTVKVSEDTSVIADNYTRGYTASVSEPLKFGRFVLSSGRVYNVYQELTDMANRKAEEYGDPDTSRGLLYITNLSVPTSQGTLYYNYVAEADTGYGVGANDRFADTASGTIRSVDKLCFVPRQGFSGTAEITFSGVTSSRNFTGVIRVNVGVGGGTYPISYRALAGEPVWFSADDFDAFCRSVNGRSYNYITFNLPKSSDGMLYYNYTVAGSGNPVSTDIRFSQSGQYTIGNVCFVPNATLEDNSEVTISFRAVDTSGTAIDGTVTVIVTAVSTGDDPSSVTIFGERGKPVTLQSSLFFDACQKTIKDTLAFVTFRLPDEAEGTLYYNYRSDGTYDDRVAAGTRCYYSGVPGLDGISFVPASGSVTRVAISYTGYGSEGTSYSGTLYVILRDVDRSVIYYSVPKGGFVNFNAADFYNAGLYTKGVGVNYVTFDMANVLQTPNTGLGTLYYDYWSSSYYHATVSSGVYYYYNPGYRWYQQLGLISFRAGDTTGTVTIPYTAVCGVGINQQTFTGKVVIQVGSPTPDEISLSCRTGGYTSAQQLAVFLNSVCGAVMNESLSYIEITSLPAAETGHLYYNYSGFGTGTLVELGDRFYTAGSPNTARLSFVPRAGFEGEAEITYIGYSYAYINNEREQKQDQVSGRVLVNVAKSTASQYFNDMGKYTWAVDSVDYLRWNNTVSGRGDGHFDPGGTVTRGDFTLMMVNAYGLKAAGSASFDDVPAGKYYADAIRVASLLGIVSGYNGKFNPEAPLTRQDAMVLIYNVLKYSGKTATNGLAANFGAYHDEGEIDAYAREAMGSLIQMGVVEGDGNGYLRPQRRLNRAEAAVLLHTIMTL